MNEKISKNFSLQEFEKSDTATRLGINNTIKDEFVKENIKALVDNILQPLRDKWGEPLTINSGYRCPQLNKAVGGVPTSQHCLGQASDVGCEDPYALAKLAKRMRLDYDQCILYPTFVHFSYRKDEENRRQLLYAPSWSGRKDL